MTARDFFDRVRSASQDAERCRSQLVAMEQRALSLGGGGFEPRTRSTPDPHRMERRVDAYVDREHALQRRMENDYRVIDLGCLVLYGNNERHGLDAVKSPVWADVLWWRYLDGTKWSAMPGVVGYSPRTCTEMCKQALNWIDDSSFMADVMDSADAM